VVIGNHTQKYTAKNPAIRWLTERWVANLEAIFGRIDAETRRTGSPPQRVLEVGCGEGVISDKLQRRWGNTVGLDLPDAGLRAQWREIGGDPAPGFLHADALRLPFQDGLFDVVVAVEVLEHLPDPAQGLAEIARVGRGQVVLSVPREPIFRGCNLIAGRYVKDLGNTPGHLNHWSGAAFKRFVGNVAAVREVTYPFPWTTVWATLR
jgi:2-polyprenyl-3-methyl-5-hydroxy-6-metoxy-1,4-benzoquinol methylase